MQGVESQLSARAAHSIIQNSRWKTLPATQKVTFTSIYFYKCLRQAVTYVMSILAVKRDPKSPADSMMLNAVKCKGSWGCNRWTFCAQRELPTSHNFTTLVCLSSCVHPISFMLMCRGHPGLILSRIKTPEDFSCCVFAFPASWSSIQLRSCYAK